MGVALFLFVAMMLALLPVWPHSRNWGYLPTGSAGFIMLVGMMLGFF